MAETTNGACRTRACPVQRANNSYGKGGEEATEGEIVAALELGNAHRFISSVQHIMSNPDLINMATESMKNMRLQDLKQVGNLEQYDIAQQRREKLIKKPAAKKAASTAKKAPPAAKKAASSSESSEEDSYEESEDKKTAQKTAKADTKTADITLC